MQLSIPELRGGGISAGKKFPAWWYTDAMAPGRYGPTKNWQCRGSQANDRRRKFCMKGTFKLILAGKGKVRLRSLPSSGNFATLNSQSQEDARYFLHFGNAVNARIQEGARGFLAYRESLLAVRDIY